MPAKKSAKKSAKTVAPKKVVARPRTAGGAVGKAAPARSAAPSRALPKKTRELQPGDAAPDFALADQRGRTVKLGDFRGRKLLLYFYPKADTPGCTTQSCAVRDARAELAREGVVVLGVSPDAPAAQARFDAKYSLGFPLLSDPDHAVAAKFGAWGEKKNYGKTYEGIIRSSFLVDEKGRIAGAWHGVKAADTVPIAREALKER